MITGRIRGGSTITNGIRNAAGSASGARRFGTRHWFLAFGTRFIGRDGFDAIVFQAIAFIAVRKDVVALAARSRRRTSFWFASALVEVGTVNGTAHDQFLAFATLFAGGAGRVFLFRLLPWTHLLPVTVRWIFFAQEFVNLDSDRLFVIGFGEIFWCYDDDIFDEGDVRIVILHFHRLHQADVLADFVHRGSALTGFIQSSSGDYDVALLLWN